MTSALDQIVAAKREHVTARRRLVSLSELEERANTMPPPRRFATALANARDDGRYGLICEIKRASPSRGLIRADFEPATLAENYAAGGATCLSVLTDEPFFEGRDAYLATAREATSLPALRKDFMIDPYQIIESRALGADCILLIMAILDDTLANELQSLAASYAMDTLVEVHDADELERALALNSRLIGINNRNLKTMAVDLTTTETLAPMVPQDRIVVGESGLAVRADLDRLADVGVTSFLIGESLMRQADVAAATKRLLEPAT